MTIPYKCFFCLIMQPEIQVTLQLCITILWRQFNLFSKLSFVISLNYKKSNCF